MCDGFDPYPGLDQSLDPSFEQLVRLIKQWNESGFVSLFGQPDDRIPDLIDGPVIKILDLYRNNR
jgi:hypothetical protein